MKGIRFYLVYESPQHKRRGEDEGNVIAVSTDSALRDLRGNYTALAPTFFHANSDVSTCSVHPDYLRENCKRVREDRAREIHPRLFERLDDSDLTEKE